MPSTLIKTHRSTLIKVGNTLLGSLLNQSEPPDAAPTGLALTVQDRTDIKLDWTDNATNEDGYKIERSLNGVDFTVIDTVVADTETYTDADLDEDTQYYYRVRAYKGEEYSDYTDIENETTGSTAFKITVDTTEAGSASDTFVLPLYNGETYDFHVNWGDGNEEDVSSSAIDSKSHTYASSGTYQIAITGTFPRIYFNNTGDKLKLISIDNWGTISWSSMVTAFLGCKNVGGNYEDAPNLSNVTSCYWMMYLCISFNKSVNSFDTSNIQNMDRMFMQCFQLKTSFSNFNIESCTNLSLFLEYCDINETGTTANYDDTLISWAAQTVNSGLSPNFGSTKYGQGKVDEGTTDGTTANKLVDSSQNFLTTVTVGDVIHNTTDGTYARVTAIDSDTTLSLDNDIMVSGEAYVIQHSDAAKARASLILDDGWTISDGFAL